jgi:hypothetical protein
MPLLLTATYGLQLTVRKQAVYREAWADLPYAGWAASWIHLNSRIVHRAASYSIAAAHRVCSANAAEAISTVDTSRLRFVCHGRLPKLGMLHV